MLIQLIYSSTASAAFSAEELTAILQQSVSNNQANAVTGLLLYTHGSFLQLLEGSPAAVDATYARIARDPRHHSIEPHLRTPIHQREFSQWHMGFHQLEAADARALPQFAPVFEQGFDPHRLTACPDEGLAILRAIAGLDS
ncbi:BLUF domain-containing protein [Aquitalea sp. ASV15]|uniref:BLUF domain-containing protein n=1 Tax=Aquitalea sp. ASV15 TaxID=2795104 RepID=UPI0018EDB68F|nr:BLUF domain-containing protein [Aquitalea sp. ASV15]